MLQLTKLPDTELIKNIKLNNCSDSLTALVNRHDGIWYCKISGYINAAINQEMHFLVEDIHDEKYTVFWNCAKSYEEGRGTQFHTWLSGGIRLYCSKKFKKALATKRFCNRDNSIAQWPPDGGIEGERYDYFFENLGKQAPLYLDDQEIIKKLADQYSPRAYPMLKMRYFDGMTLAEIGQRVGLTHERVRQLIDEFLIFLRANMEAA